jgi:hypothetical protein
VVRRAGDGSLVVESLGPAQPLADFDQRALREMAAVELPAGTLAPAMPMHDEAARKAAVAPDRLRITLREVAARGAHDTLLVLENGYGEALRYTATLHRGDRAAPTDVCLVLPGKRGYEYWPYPIDRIDLRALRLVPWKPQDGVPCA